MIGQEHVGGAGARAEGGGYVMARGKYGRADKPCTMQKTTKPSCVMHVSLLLHAISFQFGEHLEQNLVMKDFVYALLFLL